MGVKNKIGKVNTKCTNYFSPTHIKFNFSFINYEKGFTDEYKLQFLKRIRGLEFEKVDIKKEIDVAFFAGNSHRNFDDKKYAIFRLYTNDNPILARVIGRLINNVFYIFFIDIGGILYKHSH